MCNKFTKISIPRHLLPVTPQLYCEYLAKIIRIVEDLIKTNESLSF